MSRKDQPEPEIGEFLQKHRLAVRLTMAVLVPLLLLGTLEGVLRLFSFGYPTTLFLEVEGAGTYGSNRQFGWRFFPRKISRTPIPQTFLSVKPERTCRIFVLGASAALGVPNSAFSFARSLEVMLQTRYPGVDFEIVNTSLTAINSHVVLPIARECAGYDPDVYVVYLGNNEVIGPYGIGGSTGGVAGNLVAVRAGIALRTTRLGQLGQQLLAGTRTGSSDPGNDKWLGMQQYTQHMVRSSDPGLTVVHDNFRRNLEDICEAGSRAGAQVVLSTVAVNLRDSAPFASLVDSTLSTAVLAHQSRLLDAAQQLLNAGEVAAARDSLLLARRLDPQCANTHFLLGHAELGLGELQAAGQSFAQALEFDALRFRTDSRLNHIIRQTAASRRDQGVRLADTVNILRESEPSGTGIPGGELFYEHVHLTFTGNYQVARALLPTVEQALPPWVRSQADESRPLPTREQCAQRLLFTAANRYFNLEQMRTTVTPYPFTAQLGHAAMLQAYDDEMALLRSQATPELQMATLEAYQKAHLQRPNDLQLALNFAHILTQSGNTEAAGMVLKGVFDTQPPAADLSEAALNQLTGGG